MNAPKPSNMGRIGVILLMTGIIVGALFAISAAGYLAAGFLESNLAGLIKEPLGLGSIANMVVLMLVFVMVIATLLTLAERKWSALMQDRIGPNRARLPIPGLKNQDLAGLPHIVTDVLKMLTKEDFRPTAANHWLFNLGPMLAFGPVFALFAIVPAGPEIQLWGTKVTQVVANPDFGLLYMFAIASLAVYGTSIAGWSSNNKFALLGGVRASSQMISYEVALGLSLVGMMMAFSTVQLAGDAGMVVQQTKFLWGSDTFGVPRWGIFLQPFGFVLFFAAAFAETKRAPFDAPEGESEIIGYFVEYSGMKFGMFMIAEFVEVVVLAGVITCIFFGGCYLPFGNEALKHLIGYQDAATGFAWQNLLWGTILATVFWVKVVVLCYIQLAIRWTFPRFRYDQIQVLGWKILLPLGLFNLFATGALLLWDPSMKMLATFGIAEIALVLALTLTPRAKKETHDLAHGHDAHHAVSTH